MRIPPGYLPISEAVDRLEFRMFGGAAKPEPIVKIKKQLGQNLSVRFGPRRSAAAKSLDDAISRGKLTVFVASNQQPPNRKTRSPQQLRQSTLTPVQVPLFVIKRLTRVRNSLPDRPFRVPIALVREGKIDEHMFSRLHSGTLLLKQGEFFAWCTSERRKGKWPSQYGREKRPVGRPAKQTNRLRDKIKLVIESGQWNADRKGKVSDLCRMLADEGHQIPSHDTIARTVDSILLETGDSRFKRRHRRQIWRRT
jgi:hypothetical protein